MKKHTSKQNLLKEPINKYILIALLILAIIYVGFMLKSQHLIWDEYVYLSNARSHISTAHFTEDFRFPLLEFFISGTWTLIGESVIAAQILMILFSLSSVFAVFLLSKQFLKGKKWQLVATAFFGLTNIMFFWNFRIYTDIPAMSCMLFSIYFFIRGMNKEKKEKFFNNFFVAGLFAALSFLFRFPIILFIIPLGIVILLKRKYKDWISFAVGSILPLLPWLLFNTIKYKNPLWDLLAQGGAVASYTSWQAPSILLKSIWGTLAFALLLLIPFSIQIYKQRKDYKIWLLSSIIIIQILFYLFVVRLKLERYQLMFLPLVILAIIIGAENLNQYIKKKRIQQILAIAIIVIISIQLIITSIAQIQQTNEKAICQTNSSLQQAITYASTNIPADEVISANNWPPFGYYGNHRVTSTWTTNISELITQSGTDWIILVENGGLELSKEQLDAETMLHEEVSFTDICNQKIIIYKVIL